MTCDVVAVCFFEKLKTKGYEGRCDYGLGEDYEVMADAVARSNNSVSISKSAS